MAVQTAVDVLRENIEAFNAGDEERFKATLAADAVYREFGTQRTVEGRDEIGKLTFEWKQSFPDAHGTVTSISETAEGAVAEILWEGTHSGDMETPSGTIPASGKQVHIPASMVVTIEGGKVKEDRHYFDMMTLLQQIGAAS